jgi:hypothetical protein
MKHGFLFLVEKHKALQQAYEKEKQKNLLFVQTKQRLRQVEEERDRAAEETLKMRMKCSTMAQVIQMAVEE